jgi:hypothetical protein
MRNRQERVGTSLIRLRRARKSSSFFLGVLAHLLPPPLWLTPKIVGRPQSVLIYYL